MALGQSYTERIPAPSAEPAKNFSGHYVLVSREWTSQGMGWTVLTNGTSSGTGIADLSNGGYYWKYDEQIFDTLDLAIKELSRDCSGQSDQHYPCYVAKTGGDNIWTKEFVGIYKLSSAIDKSVVKFSEGDKVQSHTVEDKEHWFKWEMKVK